MMIYEIAIKELLEEKDATIEQLRHDLAIANSTVDELREQLVERLRKNATLSRRLRDYSESLADIAGGL